jgi:hypothetical protein
MPWIYLEEWRYSYIFLDFPTPEKELTIQTACEAGWDQGSIWTLGTRMKFCTAENQTIVIQYVARRNNDWLIHKMSIRWEPINILHARAFGNKWKWLYILRAPSHQERIECTSSLDVTNRNMPVLSVAIPEPLVTIRRFTEVRKRSLYLLYKGKSKLPES